QPIGDAVGQELRSGGLDLPPHLACDLDDRPPEDLSVKLVGAGHDLGLDLHKAGEEGTFLEAEAVFGRLFFAGLDDALLPIDQGAVAIGRNPFNAFKTWKGHRRARHYAKPPLTKAFSRAALGGRSRIGCAAAARAPLHGSPRVSRQAAVRKA